MLLPTIDELFNLPPSAEFWAELDSEFWAELDSEFWAELDSDSKSYIVGYYCGYHPEMSDYWDMFRGNQAWIMGYEDGRGDRANT